MKQLNRNLEEVKLKNFKLQKSLKETESENTELKTEVEQLRKSIEIDKERQLNIQDVHEKAMKYQDALKQEQMKVLFKTFK